MKQIGDAFAFPFRDPDWISKFLIGGLMVLFSFVLVGLFFLLGYSVRVCQRVMQQDPNPLPDWSDLGGLLVLGFKFAILYLLYLLPLIAIFLIFIILGVIAAVSGNEGPEVLFVFVFYLVIFFAIVPYSIALAIFTPIITIRFAQKEEIRDGLALGEIFRFFKKNWSNALIVAVIIFGLESLEGFGFLLFIIGIFFTIFYSNLVSYHLMGQLYLASTESEHAE